MEKNRIKKQEDIDLSNKISNEKPHKNPNNIPYPDEFPQEAPYLLEIRQKIYDFLKERDWMSYQTPKDLAMAISIESNELLEHFLFKPIEWIPNQNEPEYKKILQEMADVFIFLLSMVNRLELESFADIIRKKIEKNKKKYPAEKFAGKKYQKQHDVD